jgi:hypothetical protein
MLKLETTGTKHIDAELLLFGSSPVVGKRMTGWIFKDSKNRFPEGSEVRTSLVTEVLKTKEGTFVTTLNTTYKLL